VNLITTLGSFLAALALVGLVRLLAPRSGLMDMPNSRSSHAAPTPRGGGIAIVTVTLLVTALGVVLAPGSPWVVIAWILGGGLVATAGFLDDLRGMPVIARFALHVIAAIVLLIAAGGMPPLPSSAGQVQIGLLGWIAGGIGIVWSINLFNFMDGIDGLAAAQCVFVAGAGVLLTGLGEDASTTQLTLFALTGGIFRQRRYSWAMWAVVSSASRSLPERF
jgi:Fuc2NAc and GlcNAc transferase